MENPKQQLVERLRTANNVLVSVSTNPSVDQLAAAIGLTLMLNKLGKHGTAVFSGEVPSILEFLQPEKTLEKNTDSLRDFIIALDKSKADKLRYKVEDNFVRIFITPYRTSITEKDLDFSQGDFNVEVVVALGVHDQKDLDHAITAHGRILHDATTFALTTNESSTLGSVNWSDPSASSLCEMVAGLADQFQGAVLDEQIATALLTGIVAETKRFSNQKTSPLTMSLSSALMSAGANQQLVATKLEEPKPEPAKPAEKEAEKSHHKAAKHSEKEAHKEEKPDDGALQIEHEADKKPVEPPKPAPVPIAEQVEETEDDIVIDDDGTIQLPSTEPETEISGGTSRIDQPPSLGGKLTANTEPEQLDPATDPLGAGQHPTPLLSHDETPIADAPAEDEPLAPEGPQTLAQLEQAVDSPHLGPQSEPDTPPADVGGARDAVSDALTSISDTLDPIESLNAQPLGENLNIASTDQPFTLPENLVPPVVPATDITAAPAEDPTSPPTVPPPFMPTTPSSDIKIDPTTGNIIQEPEQPPASQNNPFNLPPS